jgi:hypothetical protein
MTVGWMTGADFADLAKAPKRSLQKQFVWRVSLEKSRNFAL